MGSSGISPALAEDTLISETTTLFTRELTITPAAGRTINAIPKQTYIIVNMDTSGAAWYTTDGSLPTSTNGIGFGSAGILVKVINKDIRIAGDTTFSASVEQGAP